jgi:hypothetical protein
MTVARFAIVVMDRGEREGWRGRFLEQIAQGKVALPGEKFDVGGGILQGQELRLQGEWIGTGRFEPLASADEALSQWIAVGARPFVGAPAGLFVWSHPMANGSQQRDLVSTLVRAARGAGYRLDTHELRENVMRRTFPLTEATTPYGFEEGTAFLERRPGPYMDDVVAAVKRALTASQIEIWSGFDPDAEGNNPLRIYPPMDIAGELVPNERVDSVLYHLEVEIWAFPEKLGDACDQFWIDADA